MSTKGEDHGDEAAPEVRDRIQKNLRALYDQTLSEEIPDKLKELLKKLENQETR